jgi:hypothetical protein
MADNDTSESVKDKFAARFDNDEKKDEKPKESVEDQSSESVKKQKKGKKPSFSNIKKSQWQNHSFYLPPELANSLGRGYKQLDLDLDREYELSIQKTRHYYPLITLLGLEKLNELDAKEVKEKLEALEE